VFYRSKKDYFWFALVFIAESQPGSLFILTDVKHSFSILQNTPLGLLYFWMVFIIIAFIKSLKSRIEHPFFLNNVILVMLIYIGMLMLIFKMRKLSDFGGFIPWLLLYIIPRSFKSQSDYKRFFNLIFAFVGFVLMTQIYFLLIGHDINLMLGGKLKTILPDRTIEDAAQALRPVAGITIPFFSIIGSVLLLLYKKTGISKNYLYIILITSMFSIFLSATRGWIIAALLIFMSYLFISFKNPFGLLSKFIVPIVLLLVLFNFIPSLKKQSEMAFARIETILNLAEGDVTAGGTLSRIDERSPRVMKKFWESPIFGFGDSSEATPFSDPHVGNQNLLLHMGILGFLIYIMLWLTFTIKLFYREKSLSNGNEYKHLPMMMIAALMSIIVIHSSSSQWFGMGFGYIRGFIFFFILSYGNFIYWDSIKREQEH